MASPDDDDEHDAPATLPPEREQSEPREARADSEPPPRSARPSEAPGSGDERSRRSRLERILPELIRRGLEKGLEAGLGTLQTLSKTDEALRGVVSDVKDVKLPREVAGYVFQAIEDTKNGMLRVVAREVREFLEATDLATEMQKALTTLSFEIKTEIRFIPNEAGTGVRPEVKAGRTSIKRKVEADDAAAKSATTPPSGASPPSDADAEPKDGRRFLRRRPRARRKEE